MSYLKQNCKWFLELECHSYIYHLFIWGKDDILIFENLLSEEFVFQTSQSRVRFVRHDYLVFSSPGPGTIAITWRLSSVVCRLLSVVCKLFTFQASSSKPLGQLEPNLAGMFLGWSSTNLLFFVRVGYSTWLPGPIICSDWLKFQRSSSLKLMNWLNPNCKERSLECPLPNYCFLWWSEIQDGRHRRT